MVISLHTDIRLNITKYAAIVVLVIWNNSYYIIHTHARGSTYVLGIITRKPNPRDQ